MTKRQVANRAIRPSGGIRQGVTLIELMIASLVVSMLAGALAALARSVQLSSEYAYGHDQAAQHARVCLQRIRKAIGESYGNEQFPGVLVLEETAGGYRFPDTLVAWRPSGSPADPGGLPRFNELTVYYCSTEKPNELYEATCPADTRICPAASETAKWRTEIVAIKSGANSKRSLMTRLVRVASTSELSSDASALRGAVRFELECRPSAAELSSYRAGTTAWKNLSWPQNLYGTKVGMRQAWVRIELQLVTSDEGEIVDDSKILPFFDSAVCFHQVFP